MSFRLVPKSVTLNGKGDCKIGIHIIFIIIIIILIILLSVLGHDVEVVDSFVYLGSCIDIAGGSETDYAEGSR